MKFCVDFLLNSLKPLNPSKVSILWKQHNFLKGETIPRFFTMVPFDLSIWVMQNLCLLKILSWLMMWNNPLHSRYCIVFVYLCVAFNNLIRKAIVIKNTEVKAKDIQIFGKLWNYWLIRDKEIIEVYFKYPWQNLNFLIVPRQPLKIFCTCAISVEKSRCSWTIVLNTNNDANCIHISYFLDVKLLQEFQTK